MTVLLLSLCIGLSADAAPVARPAGGQEVAAAGGESAETKGADAAAGQTGAAVARAPDGSKRKVALLGIDALGLSDGIATSLEGLLHKSFTTIDTVAMIPAVDVHIARQDQQEGGKSCAGGPTCHAQLGRLLGADIVVYGTVSGFGDSVSLNLRAMDVAQAKEIGREAASISRRQLIPEMRLAAYRLIAPDGIRGKLLIDVGRDDVTVEVDGEVMGVTPLAGPLGNLTVGEHMVRLSMAGRLLAERKLTIKAFETTRLKLQVSSGGAAE